MKNTHLILFILMFIGSAIFISVNLRKYVELTSKNELEYITKRTEELLIQQKDLKEKIAMYDSKIDSLDNSISKIKNEKVIIKEIFHEKINSIDTFSRTQLDSFFTDRYR